MMMAFGLPSHLPFMALHFACTDSRTIDTLELTKNDCKMETKILQEKRIPGNKCASCIYKKIPGAILICALTQKRIRHYQKACKNYKKNDI